VAFTLLHRKGYFQQRLDGTGMQKEDVQLWNPSDFCTENPARVTVSVEGRTVTVRCWRYNQLGRYGHVVPIYLLDTDLDGNSEWDRHLTDCLYGGDTNYRLQQEMCWAWAGAHGQRAGLPGERLSHERGPCGAVNAGIAREPVGRRTAGRGYRTDIAQVRQKCVFTTHTRFRPGMIASPPNRPTEFSAATGRSVWNVKAVFATAF